MRRLFITLALAVASWTVTAAPTHAQGCCGYVNPYIVSCPSCADEPYAVNVCMENWNPDAQYWVPIMVDCAWDASCGRVGSYGSAGYCNEDSAKKARALAAVRGASMQSFIIVNAFVRNCRGEFVAVRVGYLRPRA